jgi:hypothetical protein
MTVTPLQRSRLPAGRGGRATDVAPDLTAGTQSRPAIHRRGEVTSPRGRRSVDTVSRSRLTIIALVSLLALALLSLAVSRGYGAYRLEWHSMRLLGRASDIARWADLADLLAVPAIVSLVVVSVIVGAVHRIPLRVAAFAGFAAAALLINEHVVKPAVQERLLGALSFPSGHVTAVCATALAMWIALYPVLGRWARVSTFVLGAGWTLLMSIAVVGAIWHTPIDDVGSIFLSVGVVTAGAAILGPLTNRRVPAPVAPARVLERV